MCAFGHYLRDSVCQPCGFVHNTYCANLKEYATSYNMDTGSVINWGQCDAFAATQTTAETCATCTCNFVRNSIAYDSDLECAGVNEYVSLETFQCEHCPEAYFIVDQECVPYASHHFSRDMYNNCIPGYVKNQQIGARGTCMPCPVGMFSNSAQDTVCTACPRNLVTMSPGSISENDCAYCPRNRYMVFDQTTKKYRCEPCDACSTRREAAHMQTSCHRCLLQDMIDVLRGAGDASAPNCVLSHMGSCEIYFDTDDVFQTCRQKCRADSTAAVCNFCHQTTAFDLEGATFPGVQMHPKIFVPGLFTPAIYTNDGGIRNEDRIMIFLYDILKDDNIVAVGERHKWLEFSNLVNRDFAALRVANYQTCVDATFPANPGECVGSCTLATFHDECSRLSTVYVTDSAIVSTNDVRFVSGSQRYLDIFSKYYNYYIQLHEDLKPAVQTQQKQMGDNECILDAAQKFERVKVVIFAREMQVQHVTSMTIYDSSENMAHFVFPTEDPQKTFHEISVDLEGIDHICSITFSHPPALLKTLNTVYIDFTFSDVIDPLDPVALFSGTSVFRRAPASDATFFVCPEATFVTSPAYITDNLQYDALQKLVRPHMCTNRDYSIAV